MTRPSGRGIALVTGAEHGLGSVIARRLHRDGYQLAVNDLVDGPGLQQLSGEYGALVIPGDVSDPATVHQLVATTEARLGPVGVLVTNHSVLAMGPFLEQPADEWWRQIAVNLAATFFLARAVVPGMRRLGSGRIVLITCEAGVVGTRQATAYSAAKAGVIALTKSLGRELAAENILANAIAPSYFNSPQLQIHADIAGISRDELLTQLGASAPMGRLAGLDEIAAVVSYLAGPYARSVVGQVLQPNGGTTRARA